VAVEKMVIDEFRANAAPRDFIIQKIVGMTKASESETLQIRSGVWTWLIGEISSSHITFHHDFSRDIFQKHSDF